jgi:dihydrofolate synthase/folylpolyglutamate synthase
MTYLNAVKFILSLPTDDSYLNDTAALERMRAACAAMDSPQKLIQSIHVCGDVGKDSCCRMLESVLKSSQYSFGRYSLSYDEDPRIGISANGKIISYADFADVINRISKIYRSHFKDAVPHRHEIMTLAAILHFFNNGCDVSIFEKSTSRNDPVNITDAPLVSLATPFLDREADEEKFDSMIHKGTAETVSSPQHKDVYNAISNSCAASGSRLTIPIYSETEIESITLFRTSFKYRGETYSIRSFSPCQTVNAITAIEVVRAMNRLGAEIPMDAVKKGLSSALLDGKCETVSLDPTIILSSTCEEDRLDTLYGSLSQIKEQLPEKINVFLDANASVDVSKLLSSISSYGLSCNEPVLLSTAKAAQDILSKLTHEESFKTATLFLGTRAFIAEIKDLISDKLGS